MKRKFRPSIIDDLPNFISYYYQLKLIPSNSKKILEIGVGNKFVHSQLRNMGKLVTTLDNDKNLLPDVVADVTNTGLKDDEFDCVLCYEVLEHLPFDKFESALAEIYRITKKYAVIALPFSGFCLSIYLKFPFYEGRIFRIPLPLFFRPKKLIKKLDVSHFWAVGEGLASRKEIRRKINKVGFRIINETSPILNIHHLFWVLKKL